MPQSPETRFTVRLARSDDDLRAAQELRYQVFVAEMGADGPLTDHTARAERDAFDPHADHLLLVDETTNDVAGVYRLIQKSAAEAGEGFYSGQEYDLAPLLHSGRRLLELGRSCIHPAYRGGPALHHLWSGLADYVHDRQIELLFGVASFHGTQVDDLAQPLSLLHHKYLAPDDLRVKARAPGFHPMDSIPKEALDRRAAMVQIPSLIKSYLRLGGVVGEGAFVDHAFNTTDVCLILDTARLNAGQAKHYIQNSQ
jgi:putative hemolysin